MQLIRLLSIVLCFLASSAVADTYADRLIVLDCGEGHADDKSLWSPGENVGGPYDMADNCYLVEHKHEWLLWDTGLPDAVADRKDGIRIEAIGTTWRRKEKLLDSLARLNLKPSDIRWMALSHLHPDHIGNVARFRETTVLIQTAEYDHPVPAIGLPFAPNQSVKKVDGDYDVFGDGSVMLLSTPGHTQGHQSLLVFLKNTGAVVLSGDAVHSEEAWSNRWVPARNFNLEATRASMERIAGILDREHAQLWINHDVAQSAGRRKIPAFYD